MVMLTEGKVKRLFTTGRVRLGDEITPDVIRLWDANGKSWDKDLYRKDRSNPLAAYKEIVKRLRAVI